MPRVFAFAASLAVAALAGCGQTCSTAPAELKSVASGCTLKSNANVQIQVQPNCQNCGESSPTCGSELVGSTIELTPVFQTCPGDQGCPVQQCGTAFVCNVRTPASSGAVTVSYPGPNGQIGQATVTLSDTGSDSCSL